MWIRSQSLYTLIKCERVSIQDDGESYDVVEDGCIVLGSYSTEEKALKVLDRIEELIENQCGLTFYMPADEDVIV